MTTSGADETGPGRPGAPPAPERVLRAAVLELVGRGPLRSFAPTLSVGDPEARHATYVDWSGPRARRAQLDHALRTDVVAALLDAVMPDDLACPLPVAWLARPVTQEDPDCERHWLAACASGFAELGLPLVFVVVTRHGWHDPRTGARREWRRLRHR